MISFCVLMHFVGFYFIQDMGNSGFINYTEFVAATLETEGRIEEDKIAEAFNRIDADDTGKISVEVCILKVYCSNSLIIDSTNSS